jgi:hypothetical protein
LLTPGIRDPFSQHAPSTSFSHKVATVAVFMLNDKTTRSEHLYFFRPFSDRCVVRFGISRSNGQHTYLQIVRV